MISKDSVKLRQRKLATGNTSLYLDIYYKGRREYEYLHLYLVPERTRADREKNRDTMKFAEAVRSKRMVEVQNNRFGFENSKAEEVSFYQYFLLQMEKRKEKGTCGVWASTLKHLEQYDRRLRTLTFSDITKRWINGFVEYLKKEAVSLSCIDSQPISANTRNLYYSKLRSCLNSALNDGIITVNLLSGTDSIKREECSREYLTIDEIRLLTRTDTERHPLIKRAFVFSCLTGLRFSDVRDLTWGEVHRQGEYTRIMFRQKKTREHEYLDISPQAVELMGDTGSPGERVFSGLPSYQLIRKEIMLWAERAGIKKHITFHCARHSFAVMMLDLGTDIYTVSKLLGHRELSTTQIYAKVLDKNKQAAVSKIPSIL